MPNITVKNIPADLYEQLKQSAIANRRSINREIITCIEHGVHARKINPEALLVRARQLRQKTRKHVITDTELESAKRVGRP
jgi:antitoxin FitA